jgi:hypothetical protein
VEDFVEFGLQPITCRTRYAREEDSVEEDLDTGTGSLDVKTDSEAG